MIWLQRADEFAYFDAPFLPLAHRGGSLLPANIGRENTVHAFAQAVDLGYRWLETDVHATSDGTLVAFHDERLDRVTDGHGLIAQTPYATLKDLRVGGRDPIPTLAELLETFPHARFNIDIKAPGAIEPLVHTLNRHGSFDRVCVGSFGIDRLFRFRQLAGRQVATSVNALGVASSRAIPGLPTWLWDAGVAYQIPLHHTVAGRRVRLVTPAFIRRAHAAGRVVHVWTIDDAATMHELIDMGVDGLITDRPDTLREVCRERGLWPA